MVAAASSLAPPGPSAIVIGGSSGMGKAAAIAVASRGGSVLLASRTQAKLDSAADEIRTAAKAAAEESKAAAVEESVNICSEILRDILAEAGDVGVPLGISVEAVSGFREEIDGAFELFRRLQQQLLDARGAPWGVRW